MEVTFTSLLIRVSFSYLYVLFLVRISGKQSIGQLTTMDFTVATIIGDQFDNVIYSEVPISQGAVGFATIVLIHLLVTVLTSRNLRIHRLFASPPRMLIQNGTVLRQGLDREWMNLETVQSDMRMKGDDKLEEIKEARLETSGQVSFIKNEMSKTAQKQDSKLLR